MRFKISEAEYLAYGRWGSDRQGGPPPPLELILADNARYPLRGRIENTVNQVDPKTGTLELQATFPNPEHRILPGQFGRVRLQTGQKKDAILVPQKAVQELQGFQSVLTLGSDNKVVARTIITGGRIDDSWIVDQGLKPGDRVIVEGVQKARPGAVVSPQPYRPPSAQPEKGKGS